MDTDQLIAHSRARFEHEAARRTLREKYQAKLTFAHAGGMWQAGPELLSVLNCCTMDREVVITRSRSIPKNYGTWPLNVGKNA